MRDRRYQSWQGEDNLFAAAVLLALLVGANNSLAAAILLLVVGGLWLRRRDQRYSDWVISNLDLTNANSSSGDAALSARVVAAHLGLNFDAIAADRAGSDAKSNLPDDQIPDDKASWEELERRKLELAARLGKLRRPPA